MNPTRRPPGGVWAPVESSSARPPDVEAVFEQNYRALVRGLAFMAGVETASDAVQEAFLIADRRWRAVREMDDPVAWIRRVAINRLRSAMRSATRSERREQAVSVPEAVVDTMQDLDLLSAVGDLPEQQRLTIGLYYLGDLTVADVATALGVSPGTVKSNLHDARSRLRCILEPSDG